MKGLGARATSDLEQAQVGPAELTDQGWARGAGWGRPAGHAARGLGVRASGWLCVLVPDPRAAEATFQGLSK